MEQTTFNKMEMDIIRRLLTTDIYGNLCQVDDKDDYIYEAKPSYMSQTEWEQFVNKVMPGTYPLNPNHL